LPLGRPDRVTDRRQEALRVRPHLSVEQALSIVPDPVKDSSDAPM